MKILIISTCLFLIGCGVTSVQPRHQLYSTGQLLNLQTGCVDYMVDKESGEMVALLTGETLYQMNESGMIEDLKTGKFTGKIGQSGVVVDLTYEEQVTYNGVDPAFLYSEVTDNAVQYAPPMQLFHNLGNATRRANQQWQQQQQWLQHEEQMSMLEWQDLAHRNQHGGFGGHP